MSNISRTAKDDEFSYTNPFSRKSAPQRPSDKIASYGKYSESVSGTSKYKSSPTPKTDYPKSNLIGNREESSSTEFQRKRVPGPTKYEAITTLPDTKSRSKSRITHEDEELSDGETRRESRQRMDKGYKEMMQKYAQQQKDAQKQPKWADLKLRDAAEPDEFTVTHVNQTLHLLRTDAQSVASEENQSSLEWLERNSVERLQLTLKNLVDRGSIKRPQADLNSGKMQQHMQFDATDINTFEYKLNRAIEMYTKRIKWLLQGSRRVFGLWKGSNVAVVLDCSDANLGFGRQGSFSDILLHVLDEQLSNKSSVYLAAFGSEVWPLWSTPMDINCRTLEEAKEWVSRIRPRGGCNLLKALKHALQVPDIDHVVVVLGSIPDQTTEVLCDFVEQLCLARDIIIDTVAYDCSNHHTNITLRKLAEQTSGRYHCYSSTLEEQIYTSTDVSAILNEIKIAQNVINKIKEMKQGLLGTAIVSVMDEIGREVATLQPTRTLPRPPGHEAPLSLQASSFHVTSSREWLSKHGLKACNLDLYQVLAPNAYSFREEFVPVIGKTVQSQVHERAMAQFVWHDGSMKNVHVNMAQLYDYQKHLGAQVKLFEKRIDWLSSASRRLFGTLFEEKVVILLDVSQANANYLIHVQHSIRQLLEQQLLDKKYFNIIAFGSEVRAFKPTLVKPTPEHLQEAWRFVLQQHCSGSRNLMSALRRALENEEEKQHSIDVDGVYLFTSGVPDQSQEVCVSYLQERCCGTDLNLHAVLFNVDDYDASGAIPTRYANITQTADCLRALAHSTDGRFHWFRETGIIESDDISAVAFEIEKALNFSKKAAMLVESVKKKYGFADHRSDQLQIEYVEEMKAIEAKPLPMPKHTALSQARMNADEAAESADEVVEKPRGWRPSTANEGKARTVKQKRNQKAFFYTEQSNKRAPDYVGAVYDKYARKKSVRKAVPSQNIPEKEMQETSKQWLRKYSVAKLKLDLHKMISSPDCKHVSKPVKSLKKNAEARYCNVFPTINIRGTLKHLQLLPHELRLYEQQLQQVVARYLRRLQWLLSGSRRVFGVVVEKQVIVLIDTSGSMQASMDELRKELTSLIWEQFHKNQVKFNLVSFSGSCQRWRDSMQTPTEGNCRDAVVWVSQLIANGNTCTLEALEMAFAEADVDAVYLLSDGKPDSSTSLVLKEVGRINLDREVKVHTISFHCDDATANNFLKLLAAETSGRYHRCHAGFDAHLFAHRLLTEGCQDSQTPALPEFEGDDLRRLGEEITVAREYLQQARTFRTSYDSLKTPKEGFTVGTGAKQERK